MEAEDGGRYEVLAGTALAIATIWLRFVKNCPHLPRQHCPNALRPLISWLVARL